MGKQQLLGFFERLQSQRARDGRKPFQKVLKPFSSFEVLEERLNGHSRAPEYRRAVHDFGIPDNRLCHALILAHF
jgi:hypothetical protein